MNKYASRQKRIINYITDLGCILLVFYLLLKVLPNIVKLVPFDFEIDINIILLTVYVLYYMIFEGITGRTIGKYLTNTKVLKLNDSKPSFVNILVRSFVRLIAIEVFSYLSARPLGWHDNTSGTKVIDLSK